MRCRSWAEALRPQDSAAGESPGALASAEPPGALASAESLGALARAAPPGTDTPWDKVFQLGRGMCKTGADGRIYQARTLRGNKAVVLKFVYGVEDPEDDVDGQEKLWREVAILRKFDHPNIVSLLGTYAAPADAHFIHVQAFEEADTDLHALLRRRPDGHVSVPVARMAACQIAAGISRLHEASVLHRDIKPMNILVYLDQNPVRYVIADFGRARIMLAPKERRIRGKTAVSHAGIFLNAMAPQTRALGTPEYDAPELLLPGCGGPVLSVDAVYGFGVDVWAFACVVFEMVTGQHFVFCSPYDRLSAMIARLGHPPHMPILCAPMHGLLSLESALKDRDPSLTEFLQAAFEWLPPRRKTIAQLLRSRWLARPSETSAQSPGSGDAASAQSPGESSSRIGLTSAPSGSILQDSIIISRHQCNCGRRCQNKGHSPNGPGCQSHELVRGTDLCVKCVCRLQPRCLRPRHNSTRCIRHQRFFTSLPWTLQAVHSLGQEGSTPPLDHPLA